MDVSNIICSNCNKKWQDHTGVKCRHTDTIFIAGPVPPGLACWDCTQPASLPHDNAKCTAKHGYNPAYPSDSICGRCSKSWSSHTYAGRECTDGGPFIFLPKPILIREAKLGDFILLFLDPDDEVVDHATPITMEGRIFGINKRAKDYLVGWKEGERLPSYTVARGKSLSANIDFIPEQGEYTQRVTLYETSLIHSVVSRAVIKAPTSLEQWRFFQASSHPGMCPCGTARAVCSYHKAG